MLHVAVHSVVSIAGGDAKDAPEPRTPGSEPQRDEEIGEVL